MSGTRWRRFALLISTLTLVVSTAVVPSAFAQTKKDVDKAEAARERAYQELVDTRNELDAAVAAFETVRSEVYDVTYRLERLDTRVSQDRAQAEELRNTAQDLVVEAYMSGSANSSVTLTLEAENIQDVVTSQALYERANALSIETLDRLDTLSRELDRLSGDLESDRAELANLEIVASRALDRVNELMEESKAQFERKDDAAKDARARWEAELARRRAAEEARRKAAEEAARRASSGGSGGGSGGGSSGGGSSGGGSSGGRGGSGGGGNSVYGYLVCPSGTPMAFRDTWGAPRSGGRTHKGTDIFAPKGTWVYAVNDGRIRTSNSSLGGKGIWLYGTDGNAYYYAHLDSWIARNGDRVSQGDKIATVGNTGNASGGANHTHFQLHPGGGAPRNPYPTLAAICNR